jgi:uncharacterized protein (DUF2062 family)
LGVSVNPIVGTHIILGVIGAKLTRSNPLAAAIATFVVNPWTAPPIWFATYYTGRLMEGHSTHAHDPGFLAEMDGVQLLRAVREAQGGAPVPVVVVSAHESEAVRARALGAGADAFLTKRECAAGKLATEVAAVISRRKGAA